MQESNSQLRIREYVPKFVIEYKTNNITAVNFHSHSGYEIVWLKKGEAKYIFEEKVYHLTDNDVLFFKSSEFHKVSLTENTHYERVVVMFTDEFLSFEHPLLEKFKKFLNEQPMPHYMFRLFTWKLDQFQSIINHLINEQDSNGELWEQESALELYFLELLLFIGREVQSSYHTSGNLSEVQSSAKVTMHDRILKEINVIWDTDWRLEALAERLHFNKYYLCHFFKKEFGVAIHQYIQQRRIYEAKKLLIKTNIPIHELARKLGFATASSFIRSFKKQVNMTPKQYRESSNLHALEF